ncbi:hypothetical protein MASR2M47_16320 [Draconibacterium sp.]|jgi:hypothetical protein
MKKLVLLFTAVLLTAISANVFAQSSGIAPAPGATHNYFITPGNGSNTLLWTVTKGNLTTSAGTDAFIAAPSTATTDITWAAGLTPGDWYYVHILETDGTCTNEKVLPVQITASPFFLTLAAANATDCYDGAVTVSLADPSTPNYDHGNTTIVFTVTPTGLSTSYSGYTFDLAALDVPAGFNATAIYSGNASESAGTITVTDNALVTITYTVDNTNTYTNASAANAQDYTATAVISNGKAANGVSDNATGIYTDDTAVSRPNTSGIGTN